MSLCVPLCTSSRFITFSRSVTTTILFALYGACSGRYYGATPSEAKVVYFRLRSIQDRELDWKCPMNGIR